MSPSRIALAIATLLPTLALADTVTVCPGSAAPADNRRRNGDRT